MVVGKAMLVAIDIFWMLSFVLLLSVFMSFPLGAFASFFFILHPFPFVHKRSGLFPAASEVLLFFFVARVTATCSVVVFVVSFFLVMHFFFLLLSEKLKLRAAAGPFTKPCPACRVLMYGSKGLMLVAKYKETDK
jgi:hypothetical protein